MTAFAWSEIADIRAQLMGERSLFSVSELFHENSKITAAAPGIPLSAESMLVAPNGFKRYIHSAHVTLPPPETGKDVSVLSAIVGRRSRRHYGDKPLALRDIATFAYYTVGISEEQRRCLPSAGGLYPLELYVLAFDVEELSPGLYHYDPREHRLDSLSDVDLRTRFAQAIFVKEAAETAAASILLTGVFGRSKIKYGERAYRFVLMEAGHAMQNICLIGEALAVGVCPIGGFIDDHLNDLLDIDGVEEAALYAATIGKPD